MLSSVSWSEKWQAGYSDLFGVPVRVHCSLPDATGQAIQAVAPEDAVDPGFRNRDAVIALEIPDDAEGSR